jgi:hypothetical protein
VFVEDDGTWPGFAGVGRNGKNGTPSFIHSPGRVGSVARGRGGRRSGPAAFVRRWQNLRGEGDGRSPQLALFPPTALRRRSLSVQEAGEPLAAQAIWRPSSQERTSRGEGPRAGVGAARRGSPRVVGVQMADVEWSRQPPSNASVSRFALRGLRGGCS